MMVWQDSAMIYRNDLSQYYRHIRLFTNKNMKIILKSTVDYFQLHFLHFWEITY